MVVSLYDNGTIAVFTSVTSPCGFYLIDEDLEWDSLGKQRKVFVKSCFILFLFASIVEEIHAEHHTK